MHSAFFYREGHYSVAKLILDSNAEVNVPSGSENNIPLTLACWKGNVIGNVGSSLNDKNDDDG